MLSRGLVFGLAAIAALAAGAVGPLPGRAEQPAPSPPAGGFDLMAHPSDMAAVPAGAIRILGGTPVAEDRVSFQTYLYADGAACGGSVIAPRWVLTAAHCVVDESTGRVVDPTAKGTLVFVQAGHVEKPRVVSGSLEFSGPRALALRIVVHPNYLAGDQDLRYDIALIELDRALPVPPVRLARPEDRAVLERPGRPAEAHGWGRISATERVSSERLLEVPLEVVSDTRCRRNLSNRLRAQITDAQICAWNSRGSICSGDSGGPLLVRGSDGHVYQIGLTSWGVVTPTRKCGVAPSVFTRVSAFLPWIERHAGPLQETPAAAPSTPPPAAVAVPAPAPPTAAVAVPAPAPPPAAVAVPAPAPAPAVTPPPPRTGDRALVIGIDDYVGDTNDLIGSKADADNMVGLLTGFLGYQRDQIRVLKDAEATREGIMRALQDWLVGGSAPGGRLFLSFSGHGFNIPDDNGDEEDGVDEILIAQDGASGPDGFRNFIRDDELRALFASVPDRDVTVVIDSCHAGTMTRSFGPATDARLRRTPSGSDWTAAHFPRTRGLIRLAQLSTAFEPLDSHVRTWTAVSPSQRALVDMEAPEPQGVFTRRFIAGIAERKADSDGDGRVTHAELLDYVTVESEAYCERNRDICGLGLTPSLVGPPSLMSTAVTDGAPVPVTAAVSAPAGAGNPAPGGGPDTGGLGASAEDGRLSIRVEPDARRPVGDRIRIRVDSQVAGDFTLFEVAPSGAVTRLIPAPDSYIDRYRIAARASEVVPAYEKTGHEWFGVAPPVGAYRLVAVVSEAPLNQDLLNRVLTESGAQPFIDALAAQLRAPVVGADETVRRARWSLASATYEVVP